MVCKIENQVLKAVLERKGTLHNLALNEVGKKIYWLLEEGQLFLSSEYVQSELNVSDKFIKESPGLETSLTDQALKRIWDLEGKPLAFFSR